MKINNEHKPNYQIKAKRISGDGVFFRCSNCNFEPEMKSKTDDLLNMNYWDNSGSKFYKSF